MKMLPQRQLSHLPSLRGWIRLHVPVLHYKTRVSAPTQGHTRPSVVMYASYNEYKELLSTLGSISEDDLESWVAQNREQLTISFLSWVAEEEAAAPAGLEQERLWDLGSRLMALREGLTPVSAKHLSKDLALAATQTNKVAIKATGSMVAAGASSSPALAEAVRHNAALGLSLEGMELLEQQASALEATMGTQRAQALTEIIGRKEMTIVPPRETSNPLAADAAGRILEVLLQIDNREDRSAMLPEAFTPPRDEVYENQEEEEENEQEELYTTPLQLLQAVDLWLHRAQSAPPPSTPYLDAVDPSSSTLLIAGYSLGLDSDQLVRVLQELREDILGAWEYSSTDDF
ncbi:hypothetical protein Ndes2526B_g03399 [Nannochloris sp. 'desiccata']|nr:hypothetical protein KSW81_002009 [Chlorella desiccata (nom. nud.)]KAG7673183.1 hypothetical protein KSW81_006397 [Chlorella desiccata (nom. nud.)]KAH7622565.1 hypothetical protein NADE_005150 [Chlorella desiccata (nom. nud.)]